VTRHVWDGTDSGKAYCGVAYDHDRDVVTARCSDCDACKARHDLDADGHATASGGADGITVAYDEG
jgi:hypothetical protein